jgi:hypothetical protein
MDRLCSWCDEPIEGIGVWHSTPTPDPYVDMWHERCQDCFQKHGTTFDGAPIPERFRVPNYNAS